MPLPDYKYGKVEGLSPDLTVISERGESPMVCCGYCSAQMACWTAVSGVSRSMTDEAHAIRRAGGRAHNAGNTASELREGALKAVGVVLRSVAIADIPGRLKDGFAVTAGIQYADLPAWLKVQTNDFGHAVCLYGYDAATNRVGMFDPLWTQGARGAWVPWITMRDALWPNGNHSTTVEQRDTGADMGIFFNPARWKATKDIPVYLESACTTKITTIKAGATFSTLGAKAVKDKAGGDGWTSSARAVLVKTGGLVEGTADPAQEAILWAKGADFPSSSIATSQAWDDSIWALALDPNGRYPAPVVPPIEPPPVDPDADCSDEVTAAIMQRDQEWEDAIKGGEPWPGQ